MARLRMAVGLGLALTGLITASVSDATFAGRNGRIAFEHITSSGPQQIVTVTPSGRHARTLTDFNRPAAEPAFSPRGGRIAFTLFGTPKIPDKLFTMRSGSGAQLKKLTHGCVGRCISDAQAAWSPDGRQIAFNRAYGPIVDDAADHVDLMVVNRNGTHQRVILPASELNKRRLEAQVQSWSPDGEQLALLVFDLDSPGLATAIYTFELDSGDLHRVTPWRLNAGNPDYSPDGRRIVFNSHYEGQSHSSLYTLDADGSDRRRLNHPRKHYTFDPTFSPSGNQIVYVVAGRATTLHLSRMTLGGEERARVTRNTLRAFNPDWGARP